MLLANYLYKYLLYNNNLGLKGIGTFKHRTNLIDYNAITKEFSLLKNSLSFIDDSTLTDNDFILFVSNEENINFEKAQKIISEDIFYWKNLLNEGKLINLSYLGSLKYMNNQLVLFPNREFNPYTFGLKERKNS